jgi:hypothetical protein
MHSPNAGAVPPLSVTLIAVCWAALLMLLTCPSGTSADTSAGDAVGKPRPVQIGIKLDQIVNIDQKAESFTAVYTLQLRYREPALAFERSAGDTPFKLLTIAGLLAQTQQSGLVWPDFVLENMQGRRDVNLESVQIHPDGEVRYFERATATFQAPDFDFRGFPFDTQVFFIRVLLQIPDSIFVFEPLSGATGIGDQLGEEEWLVSESFSELDTRIGLGGLSQSQFSLGFRAHRHLVYYIVRIFVPMLIILLVSWFTFRLRDYAKRIDIGITVLLLFIALNFTLGSDLPRLGYLTAVDAVVAGTFLITGAVILLNVQLRFLQTRGREDEARRLDRFGAIIYWPAYLLGLSGALLMI